MTIITHLADNKTLLMLCECKNEVLLIEYDHETNLADLAIFEHSFSYRSSMSLWQRLRYCWRVLVYKKPYIDQIALNNKNLKELRTFLASLNLGV